MELADIFSAQKSFSGEPQWVERDPKVHRGRLSLTAPLEIDGVTVAGLSLRGTAMRAFPDEAVCFQVVYAGGQADRGGPISRIEWRPFTSHNNKGRGPLEFRHRLITGSHHHRFDLSLKHAPTDLRRGYPAIAVPMSPTPAGAEELDPQTYIDLLDFVGIEFRINDIRTFIPDPWGQDLFRKTT